MNELRDIWDPPDENGARRYKDASFVRQSQSWPDVLLTTNAPGSSPLMGIELKGWFVLSKEGEPSFRYKVNPEVCTQLDLLAVYPWRLSDVLSGPPKLMPPFVEEARYAAEMRNYYWAYTRKSKGESTEIGFALDRSPYPKRGQKFLDRAVKDSGGNFGRVSRAGIMREFIVDLFEENLAGIPVKAWRAFFTTFRESADLAAVVTEIRLIQSRHAATVSDEDESGLTLLFKAMLEYAADVSGSAIHPTDVVLEASGFKVSATLSREALTKALESSEDDHPILAVRAGSSALSAMADARSLRSRLQRVVSENIRVELSLGDDGILKISKVGAA